MPVQVNPVTFFLMGRAVEQFAVMQSRKQQSQWYARGRGFQHVPVGVRSLHRGPDFTCSDEWVLLKIQTFQNPHILTDFFLRLTVIGDDE